MSYNVVDEYISYSEDQIEKYLKMILEKYFDKDIYDDLINAYKNARYYDSASMFDDVFEINIVKNLKEVYDNIDENDKFKDKVKYMFYMFKYIFYFDSVIECSSVRPLIKEIKDFRDDVLKLEDNNFEAEFYDLLKNDLIAKKEFLDNFKDKNFEINYIKLEENLFNCELEHNLKFSKIYSDYAIKKVFNSKDISEQKLLVIYPLVAVKILENILKGNFQKKYLVDYCLNLKDKPKKKQRILKFVSSDIVKEKIALKISVNDYLENKEEVYGLTRDGFKIALLISKEEELTEELLSLFEVFTYIITNNEKIYERIKSDKVIYVKE